MATIQKMNGIIQPEIKRLFNNFFEDKYTQEALETIIEDLFNMVRNDVIDEIYFGLFDSVEQKIINGFSLKISSNQASNLIEPKNFEPEKSTLSTTLEKFLIIKLNEKVINESENIELKLKELTNKWDFLKQPEIKMKAEKQQLLWVEDIKIEFQEISNG